MMLNETMRKKLKNETCIDIKTCKETVVKEKVVKKLMLIRITNIYSYHHRKHIVTSSGKWS